MHENKRFTTNVTVLGGGVVASWNYRPCTSSAAFERENAASGDIEGSDSLFSKCNNKESVSKGGRHTTISKRQH